MSYVLAIDAGDHIDRQDLHLFDPHYSIFEPYAGMRVKITGKKVTGEVNGTPVAYILPGRLARGSSYDAVGSTMAMPAGALAAGPLAAAIGV